MGTSNVQSFCSLLCSTDHSVCLQGKMANQPTGGWRRPWTASRGSSRQPAWPVQLSETPHEATRHPSRPKAPLGYLGLHGLGPAGSQQPPARGSTAQYYPRRQLAAAAHCLTEHRFPCPQNAGRAGCHVGTPRRGRRGGGLAARPTLRLLFKIHEETALPAPAGRRTGFLCLLPSRRARARALSREELHFGNDAVSFQESPGLWGPLPFAGLEVPRT